MSESVSWLDEAIRRFPEELFWHRRHGFVVEETSSSDEAFLLLHDEFSNPYSVWIELQHLFADAWRKSPPDRDLINRIWRYVEWCGEQPRGEKAHDDLLTAITVCFMEHIPGIPGAVADLPNRIPRASAARMRETFSYLHGEEGFQRVMRAYEKPASKGHKRRR